MESPHPLSAPTRLDTLREAAVAVDFARLLTRFPEIARYPRGNGEPVMVLPGFSQGDRSTWFLRAVLRRLGYRVRGWGLGANTGDVPKLMPGVTAEVTRAAREGSGPLRLVGWSLGGYLAREAARDVPEHVDRVVTLGSPVIGGPKYTATAPIYRAAGTDFAEIEAAIEEREQTPIRVPVTAVYSRSDGIVAWGACIDRRNPRVDHVEVRSTHIGLGFSPEALRVVADSLAAPSDSRENSARRAADGTR